MSAIAEPLSEAAERVLRLVDGCADFRQDFAAWLADNTVIWERFETEATSTWMVGRRHYSARTLIEYIRHDTMLTEVGGEWKINGNFVPDLSRLYMMVHPDRAGFFELRHQAGPNAASKGVRGTVKDAAEAPSSVDRQDAVTTDALPPEPERTYPLEPAPEAEGRAREERGYAEKAEAVADATSDFMAFALEGMDAPASMY